MDIFRDLLNKLYRHRLSKAATLLLLTSMVASCAPVAASTSSTASTGGIMGTTITNITGNGHTVYYDPSSSPALNGQTYTLNGGGYLKPAG